MTLLMARAPFEPTDNDSSWGRQVDLAVVWIFAEVMTGGLAVGTLLILARPRDEEAAALYRSQARRALTRLHVLVRSTAARVAPRSSS